MTFRCCFSLRALLINISAVAAVLAWYAFNAKQHAGEKDAIAGLQAMVKMEVLILYDDATQFCGTGVTGKIRVRSPKSTWMRAVTEFFDISAYDRVDRVGLWGSEFDDRVIPHILAFSSPKNVTLRYTRVSEAGAKKLRRSLPAARIEVSGDPDVLLRSQR